MSDRPRTSRSAADVLADWRDAERRIGDEPSGTPAGDRARLEAAELAGEFQAVVAGLTEAAHDLATSPSVRPSSESTGPRRGERLNDCDDVVRSTE